MANAAERVFNLVKEPVEALGLKLWDVRYLKEGASWYLRIFIDKDGGVTIDDCTDVSHAVDPIIDEADPIDNSYYLEVCSPGIERELTRPEHFTYAIGKEVCLKLYHAENGIKEFKGRLKTYDSSVTVETENGEIEFDAKNISKVYTLGGI